MSKKESNPQPPDNIERPGPPSGPPPIKEAGDFESLKQAAKDRIAAGDNVGLNPHKVLRLCIEFEQLKARDEGRGTREVAAYKQGFEDAKKVILQEVQKLGKRD